jgi:hypothetical protein
MFFRNVAATRRHITNPGIHDLIRSFTKAIMLQVFSSESEQQDSLRICSGISKECRTVEGGGPLQWVVAGRGGSEMGRSEWKGA